MVVIHFCSELFGTVQGKRRKQRFMLWWCGFNQLVRVPSQLIGCGPPLFPHDLVVANIQRPFQDDRP